MNTAITVDSCQPFDLSDIKQSDSNPFTDEEPTQPTPKETLDEVAERWREEAALAISERPTVRIKPQK